MAVRARRAEEAERTLRNQAERAAADARTEAAAGQRIISLLNRTYGAWRPVAGRRAHTLAWTGLIEALQQQARTNSNPKNRPVIERLNSLIILGDHASWAGDLATAESLLREALKLSDRLEPEEEPVRAGIFECLGLVQRRAGQTRETEQSFAEALAIRERSQAADPVAIRASYSYAFLCSQAQKQGDWARAEELGRLHIEAMQQTYGPTNLATAEALINLGRAYAADGKMAEAGAAYSKALADFRALPSLANDPELPEICHDINHCFDAVASYLRTTGKDDQAAGLAGEAAAIVQRIQNAP